MTVAFEKIHINYHKTVILHCETIMSIDNTPAYISFSTTTDNPADYERASHFATIMSILIAIKITKQYRV